MYEYSPIKKLYVKNFRNIGEAELDFTQSPIIALVGENEAGKTSIIKAFATCALHANPREQKDYIRDGTQMFGVAIDLENGTRIVRIKEATGINSYQVLINGQVIWSTNKITDGLPLEVQKAIGLIAEPETGEFLHIRTYEDRLLFVVTPNSVNYKVMYNALKVEQLTKAIKQGSNEVNALKSQINTNDISIQTLTNQVRAIKIMDLEALSAVKNRLISQLSVLKKIEKAKLLVDKINSCETNLGALLLIDKFSLQAINELIASKLINTSRLINNRSKLRIYIERFNELANTEIIDYSIVTKCCNILNKQEVLKEKISNAGTMVHLSTISEISESKVIHLTKLNELLNRLEQKRLMISTVNTENLRFIEESDIAIVSKIDRATQLINKTSENNNVLQQIEPYIVQAEDYLKQCGVAVETCSKCGESVIFDIDKLG